MMNSAPARGRRAGKPETRSEILAVARDRFLAEGYAAVTLRSIAADAGVDVALISYHFGSKRGLFAAALALVVNPADVLRTLLEGDVETLAPRAIRAVVTVWDHPQAGPPLQQMLRNALADPALAGFVRSAIETELVARLAARLGGPDATIRAGLFASQISGLIFSRYLIAVEPMARMDADEIARRLGPPLTLLLRGPVRGPVRSVTQRARDS